MLILSFGASSFFTTSVRRIDTSDGLALLKGGTVRAGEDRRRPAAGRPDPDQRRKDFVDNGTRVQFYYVAPQGQAVVRR